MKKLISKFIRIAKEGLTIDGRTITAEQLSQMAASYDPATYGARIWMEHFRSLFSDGAFPALGDVMELKTEKDRDGKLLLLARVRPNDKLMEMNKQDQKVFTSIEMDPDFAATGQAYLVGLAVTDSPASLGTERLQFTQQYRDRFADGEADRKTQIWPAVEAGKLEFSEEEAKADPAPSLFARVQNILAGAGKKTDERFSDVASSIIALAEGMDAINEKLSSLSAPEAPTVATATADQVTALETQLVDLKTQLSMEPDPASAPRPLSTGFSNAELTDC